MPFLPRFIKISHPLLILELILFYTLGAGIARFLGESISWDVYWLGQAWCLLVLFSACFLNEYFTIRPGAQIDPQAPGAKNSLAVEKRIREIILWIAIAALAATASLSVLLLRIAGFDLLHISTLLVIFFGALLYAIPPLRLANSGYGELVIAVLICNLVPALAFFLQRGELHRLLAMATFPLIALQMAMLLAFELPGYAADIKYNRQTLLARLGWQKAMALHNILILSAFVLFGLGAVFGMPIAIALPAMLALPLGGFQIWMMNRIAEGAKPNWTALNVTAAALVGVAAYLLTFAFWTR